MAQTYILERAEVKNAYTSQTSLHTKTGLEGQIKCQLQGQEEYANYNEKIALLLELYCYQTKMTQLSCTMRGGDNYARLRHDYCEMEIKYIFTCDDEPITDEKILKHLDDKTSHEMCLRIVSSVGLKCIPERCREAVKKHIKDDDYNWEQNVNIHVHIPII